MQQETKVFHIAQVTSQYLVITYNGKEFQKENMCISITESHTHKNNSTFWNLVMFIFLPVFLNVLWTSNNNVWDKIN